MIGVVSKELEEFRSLVDEEVGNVGDCTTVDQLVAKFRQPQVLKRKLVASQVESERGETMPLDIDEMIAHGTQRAAGKGIVE